MHALRRSLLLFAVMLLPCELVAQPLIFSDGFETGVCGGPWSSFVGAECPLCPTVSGLEAAITKQIVSQELDGSCTLQIEILTLTDRPLKVIADGIATPPDPDLTSINSSCGVFQEVDFRCFHNMFFALDPGEIGAGDYSLMLQGQCDPVIGMCPLCTAVQVVDFTTSAGANCPAPPEDFLKSPHAQARGPRSH
jgi:hypothetical protein